MIIFILYVWLITTIGFQSSLKKEGSSDILCCAYQKDSPLAIFCDNQNLSTLAILDKKWYNVFVRVINLSSGSDGNITYIEDENNKILLDMGISCSETVKRLEMIGVAPSEITSIIISHEHSDHIKGVDVFSSKYNTPVYAHEKVWVGLDDKFQKVSIQNRKIFDGQFQFEDLIVSPVEVPHDVKCFGFSFSKGSSKISIVTDLGHVNDQILHSIKGSQIVYLEANYDRTMLLNGTNYPLSLKRRIDGPNGHLSNKASADAIEFLAQTGTKQIVLSHLSKENNTPTLAYNTITEQLQKVDIIEGKNIKIDVATTSPGTFFRLK